MIMFEKNKKQLSFNLTSHIMTEKSKISNYFPADFSNMRSHRIFEKSNGRKFHIFFRSEFSFATAKMLNDMLEDSCSSSNI